MKHSIYIHIPFCKKRCHYCDFNTYAGQESRIPAYMQALNEEIRIVINQFKGLQVHSIYFGGGTPSLVPVEYYSQLIKAISVRTDVTNDCEITLEANPGTLSLPYLEGLRETGINRLSLGVQSTDTYDLARLDRIHSINDVLECITNARRAGFNNLSLDLIFGLPWQDLKSWQFGLDRAIALAPEHFSLYSLIVEPGTPLFQWYQKGWIEPQDQDREADMYEYAITALKKACYGHYEISNWAKQDADRDFRSRHNHQYWLNQPYFGFGAGAHGYVNAIRTANVNPITTYIRQIGDFEHDVDGELQFPASPSMEVVDKATQMRDFMLLGLRLVEEGVTETRFMSLYGCSMRETFSSEINQLVAQGLVEWRDGAQDCLRLSPRGVFLANRVFREFV